MKPSKFTKREWSYIFYDWAESCFTVIIGTFIFPSLYGILTSDAGLNQNVADSIFGYIVAAISLFIALLSPILGTISDYQGYKKKFFRFFFLIGIVFTILLAFYPAVNERLWWVVLIPYVFATIGYAGTNVFYDSFIVDATTDENMDRVSTTAYAFGYIGGSTLPLIIAIVLLTILPNDTGMLSLFGLEIPYTVTTGFQLTFLITAFWWLGFSRPFRKNVTQIYGIAPEPQPVKKSFQRLFATLKDAKRYKKVFLFLLAFFLYIDGVHTIINLAQRFADNALEAVTAQNANDILLPIFLAIQVAAFVFAMIFAKLSRKYKTEQLLFVTIGIYAFISLFGVFVTEVWHFWILGMLVATSQGAVQSLSRSYFGKIIPKEKANEFFGLYTVFGRFAAILGPFIVSSVAFLVNLAYPDLPGGTMRYGVLALIVLFFAGGYLFYKATKTPADYLKEGR
jgi:MFS transporter, UMF1 family